MLPLSMQYGPLTAPLPLKAKAAPIAPPYCINYQLLTETRLSVDDARQRKPMRGQVVDAPRQRTPVLGQTVDDPRQRETMPGQTIGGLRQLQPIFGQTIRGLRQCQTIFRQTFRGLRQPQPMPEQTFRGLRQPKEIPCGNGVLRVLFISGGLWHLRSGSCFQPPRFITLLPPPFPQGNPNL